jgi:hypothetical protein
VFAESGVTAKMLAQMKTSPALPLPTTQSALTPAQFALWFLHRISPDQDPYHIATAIHFSGRVRVDVMRECIRTLAARHEALRTVIASTAEVHFLEAEAIELQVIDASGWTAEELTRQQTAHIDLPMEMSHGPLTRFLLFVRAAEQHTLLIVAHHLVCDGWSMEILHRELAALYRALVYEGIWTLEPSTTFGVYQRWQLERLQLPDVREQIDYWFRQLRAVPQLALGEGSMPMRPASVRTPFRIRPEWSLPIAESARKLGITPFVQYAHLLRRALVLVTGQDDVAFGTDSANRPHAWMRNITGMMANQLVIRSQGGGLEIDSLDDRLQMAKRIREALRHQDVPFSWVVSAVNPLRRAGSNPLFQLMFTYRNAPLPSQHLPGLSMRPAEVVGSRAKFDATLALTCEGASHSGYWEFHPGLVDEARMHRLQQTFEESVRQLAEMSS